MSNTESFTVVDKRGQNRVEEKPVIIEPETPKKAEKHTWKGKIGYIPTIMQGPGGMMIVLRALGLRDDDCLFTADYLIPPNLPDNFDWKKEATKRLNTYLECNCSQEIGHCGVHQIYEPQWTQQDAERVNRSMSEALPECIEFMIRQRQQQQPKIVQAKGPLPKRKQ